MSTAHAFLNELTRFADPARHLQRLTGFPADDWQREVLACDEVLQLILASRGIGKSTTLGLKAAMFAEANYDTLTVLISPAFRQSQELFRVIKKARGTFNAAHSVLRETQDTLELANGARILCLSGDNEDTIRGFRADFLLLDEGCRLKDETYAAVIPMLVENGRVISASTPAGRRGWFFEATDEGKGSLITARSVDLPRMTAIVARDRTLLTGPKFRTEHLLTFAGSGEAFFDYEQIEAAFIPGKEIMLCHAER